MAPTGQVTASALQAMLKDAALAGSWTLDPARSAIGLRSKSMWGLAPVKGTFREVAGNGTVSPDGQVSGTITVAAASIDATVSAVDGDEVWLDAEVLVNRADFGLTWNQLGMASMRNTITVHAVFTRS